MRYAIFTDVHANLEALEAVLAKIDELRGEAPIDQIWFLGDLIGYGPNPNECIRTLRERTSVILAGNHDWAAIGKLDLDDFSPVARISAEWTAKQLTEEHITFLKNLPERIVLEDCTLAHGSPYGPLWEYLTSEALAERSFQYFDTRYCFVGHTHVPIIFQQPDEFSNTPTVPLASSDEDVEDDEETQKMAAVRPGTRVQQNALASEETESAVVEPASLHTSTTYDNAANGASSYNVQGQEVLISSLNEQESIQQTSEERIESTHAGEPETDRTIEQDEMHHEDVAQEIPREAGDVSSELDDSEDTRDTVARLDNEVEELLALLGLSQSLVKVTNEMFTPPIGDWQAPDGYRAIVNPGGVGQPRDGNPQAAFMIFDTEKGFTFYRIPYDYEKTQKKIIEAGLPAYLAARLAYGR